MSSQRIGFWLGLAVGGLMFMLPAPEGLNEQGWRIAALASLMAIWWATEAVPLALTGLLPLIYVPLTTDLSLKDTVAPPYASPIVLLLMGGSIMAKGIEKWGLHERIALTIVAQAGDHPKALVAGFMVAVAVLSMWISNTATTLMMIPIVISAAQVGVDKDGAMTKALLLGVAYAASIGGVATPIGTPTNLIALNALSEATGETIGFVQWMLVAIPAVIMLLPAAWFFVTQDKNIALYGGEGLREVILKRKAQIGKMTKPEQRVLIIFSCVALMWVFRSSLQKLPGLGGLSDMVIAFIGVFAMMVVPPGKAHKDKNGSNLLDWKTAETIPLGILLLFGGGLSLAACISDSGLSAWLGGHLLFLEGLPKWAIIAAVITLMIFLTELTSNVATTSTLMPVLAVISDVAGIPFASLAAPAAIAASCAFMLPVATAPNAIAFGTGQLHVADMVKRGARLNWVGVVGLTLLGLTIAPWMLNP